MAKLTTQAGGISLGRGAAVLAGLATVMTLSRLLPPQDYGTYRQVWLIFFTLAPVLELGVPQSVSFFGPQITRERRKTYLAQNGVALLGTGLLTGLCLFSCARPIAQLFGNPDLVAPLRAFALYPAMTMSFNIVEYALITHHRPGTAGWITGASAAAQAAITMGGFLGGATLAQICLWLGLFALLRWSVAAAAFLFVYRDLRVTWDWSELRGQLAFALPMGAATMVGLLGRQIDKLVISSRFPPELYAVYANGSYDVPLIGILTMSITAVIVPAIVRARARGDLAEVQRLWHGAARRVATLFFPAAVFLFIAAEPFMILLFSAEYAESARPFRIFLLLLPLRIAFYSGFLRALGRTGPIFFSSLGALAISFVLALVLIRVPGLGFLGPAIAIVAGSYWAALYTIRVALRELGWRWRDYFPWRRLAGTMAVALAAGAPALLAGALLSAQPAPPRLLAMGLVYGGVYLTVGEITRAARLREWLRAVGDTIRQR
ncbi:MAG: oligosaccharide flippase family protein [Candidatus Eisenbacteria bacterium]|uniref:Oligosaccharide flippase family protein n=1 Tax=Eiseniibacteriota bacterium TaxID=2212470 RepID=A0A938BQQ2_UNCEI|nr:oligosaccharide flippase family protein [Candidatus Eisenbacteria bacterium]